MRSEIWKGCHRSTGIFIWFTLRIFQSSFRTLKIVHAFDCSAFKVKLLFRDIVGSVTWTPTQHATHALLKTDCPLVKPWCRRRLPVDTSLSLAVPSPSLRPQPTCLCEQIFCEFQWHVSRFRDLFYFQVWNKEF